jgi:CxxC-x17-CxxC domain-containing protein
LTDSHQLRQARDQFVALLEDPYSPEREWQKLFTNFPFILTDCLSLGIDPQKLIPCRPGRAEADFFFFPEAHNPLSPYGVIEIKRPSTRILRVPRKEVICLSADATTAVAQAQKYATELKANISKSPSQLIILGNSLHMFVIAGLSGEIAQKVTTQILSSQVAKLLPPGCRLVPFDVLSQLLTSQVPPRLHVVVPWYPGRNLPHHDFPAVRKMYEVDGIECAACGKSITLLPFMPSPDRPVICTECWKRNLTTRRVAT